MNTSEHGSDCAGPRPDDRRRGERAGLSEPSAAYHRAFPFDAEKDLVPISMIGKTPNVLVVHPAVPAKTVAEYIAHAKAGAGKITYASPGVGTSPHMTMELFNLATGINLIHVAYKAAHPRCRI